MKMSRSCHILLELIQSHDLVIPKDYSHQDVFGIGDRLKATPFFEKLFLSFLYKSKSIFAFCLMIFIYQKYYQNGQA